MNGTSSRQKAIGPSPTSMNGRRRPSGVWNESLHGPTIGESVKAKKPSAPMTRPIKEPDLVNVCRSGGRATEIVVIEKASVDELHRETLTQIKWLKTQAKVASPQALVVGSRS